MPLSSRIVLLLGLVLTSPTAQADPAADASARFQEGRRLFRGQQFAPAREAFQAAYDILPDPRVLANVAACLASEGRAREAVVAYRRFLQEAGAEVQPDALAEARSEVARLLASLGDLVLTVEPAGAEIRIDGQVAGTAPLPGEVALEPGAHRLEVRAEGREPWARELEISAGQRVDLRVVLEAPRAVPPAAPMLEVEVVAPPPPAPRETPLGRGPLLWSGAALTGTLLLVGIATGSIALSQEAAYEEPGTSRARRRELYDSMNSLATATDVLLDTALVLGLATVALYLFAGPVETAPSSDHASAARTWDATLSF